MVLARIVVAVVAIFAIGCLAPIEIGAPASNVYRLNKYDADKLDVACHVLFSERAAKALSQYRKRLRKWTMVASVTALGVSIGFGAVALEHDRSRPVLLGAVSFAALAALPQLVAVFTGEDYDDDYAAIVDNGKFLYSYIEVGVGERPDAINHAMDEIEGRLSRRFGMHDIQAQLSKCADLYSHVIEVEEGYAR